MNPLVLASTSPYRRELLGRLGWPFESKAPTFDEETAKKNAPLVAAERATFLARGKAQSLAFSDSTVIGGDQLVSFDGEILGKPGTPEKAVDQLLRMSGKSHDLLTAVCVIKGSRISEWVHMARFRMRKLSRAQIEEYVRRDNPVDCAGSYKFEKQGLLLFEKIDCDDYTAIQGLPLIELSKTLIEFGFVPFSKGPP